MTRLLKYTTKLWLNNPEVAFDCGGTRGVLSQFLSCLLLMANFLSLFALHACFPNRLRQYFQYMFADFLEIMIRICKNQSKPV